MPAGKRPPASRGKRASCSVSSVTLRLCCSVTPPAWGGKWTSCKVDNLKLCLKLLLTVLQRENTRLAKEVDKLEDKLWKARERADLDSQAVGDAHKKAEQAARLAAAAESRRKEVQGHLDELQPQLQVSLRSLHGVLWQGQLDGLESRLQISAVPTPVPVAFLPLLCAHGNSIVEAC